MNENIRKFIRMRNELLAEKVMKGLESRNMTAYYAANKEEALAKALELIPEGSSIGMGGAMTWEVPVNRQGLMSDSFLRQLRLTKEHMAAVQGKV